MSTIPISIAWPTNYSLLQADEKYLLNSNKPKLVVNTNCHSCSILGHPCLFGLDQYYIQYKDGTSDDYPVLYQDGNEYRGIALQRQIFKNIGNTTVTDEQLEKGIVNEHRNCTHP
jgi:hypothetical protein